MLEQLLLYTGPERLANMDEELIEALKDRPYFFDAGLRFECQRCGGCCNGEPGLVRVSPEECRAIAAELELEPQDFERFCVHEVEGVLSLREDESGRCIYYENGCAIYAVRPVQCRSFPFWPQYLRSPEAWAEAARRCPGVNRGRLFTKAEIFERMQATLPSYIELRQAGRSDGFGVD